MPEGIAEKWVMPVMPGGFDQDAAQVRVSGFGDVAARLLAATRVLRGDQARVRHDARGRGEAARVSQLGGDGERGEIVDAAKTAEPLDARAEGLDGQQIAQFGIHRLEPADRFINGTDIGPVGLLERWQRPALRLQPRGMALRPGALGGRESPAVAQEEFGQAMPRTEEVDTNVLPASEEVA